MTTQGQAKRTPKVRWSDDPSIAIRGRIDYLGRERRDFEQPSYACEFIVHSPHRFRLVDDARLVATSGQETWIVEDGVATYHGPGHAQLPSALRRMLLSDESWWQSAMDAVRAGETTVSIDEALRVVDHEETTAGVGDLFDLALIPAADELFEWWGNERPAFAGRTAYVSVPESGASNTAAHVHIHPFEIANCTEDAPARLGIVRAIDWARRRSSIVIVERWDLVDDGDPVRYSAGRHAVSGLQRWHDDA